jgi:hypothetical protein
MGERYLKLADGLPPRFAGKFLAGERSSQKKVLGVTPKMSPRRLRFNISSGRSVSVPNATSEQQL